MALAGIGCHVMATAIYPDHNKTITHMGGEGAPWIGQAPFSKLPHVFANLGDGTYFHSGSLSIRAAIAAKINITYKILFNDAVAMTGGQPIDGQLSPPAIARQLAAEGVGRIALVTEDLSRYSAASALPPHTTIHDRSDLTAVQKELRATPGVSALIYDQTCAAEKRRRRKKGEYPQAPKRVFINQAVCEGCGDCGMTSNCTSILPVETEFGRKRVIDQSSCNQDYSCVKGFCPSFVTVEGAKPKKPRVAGGRGTAALAEPVPRVLGTTPYNVLITGIGGTGVITIGALLGMAAHLEGKGISVLDMTGMSQKNGSVTSHVRIAAQPDAISAQRIATGEADLVLGCDMLTAGAPDAIAKTRAGRTVAVINTHQQPTGHFAQQPDWTFPAESVRSLMDEAVGGQSHFLDATRLATALIGDAIAANLFMLGYAFQRGLIPLKLASIERAIELNGVAVNANRQAFEWGRRAAADIDAVERATQPVRPVVVSMPQNLSTVMQRRAAFLTDYQNAAYAQRYLDVVEKIRVAETPLGLGDGLSKTVAQNFAKLLAYKDEYEVARLYASPEFKRQLDSAFESGFRVKYNLAPPLFAKFGDDGQPVKSQYGGWMTPVFRLLAKFKSLRGGAFDLFGYTAERKLERQLIRDYEAMLAEIAANLTAENRDTAIALAALPERIRGFGHVKRKSIDETAAKRETLLTQFRTGASVHRHAA